MQDPVVHHDIHGTHGPFLLLVHGLMSSRAQWTPNIKALSTFCRPVVVELFGHGRSPSPEDPQYYTPDHYISQFEKVRDSLNIRQWFVCGQSLGAALTLHYSLHHPGRFIAQIFTNSRSALSDESHDETMVILKQRLARDGRKIIDTFPLHPSRSRHMPSEIKKEMVEAVDLVDVNGFANTLLYTVTRCSVRSRLDKIQVPTLMIVGRYDTAFSRLRNIAEQRIPQLETIVLDGGHAVNIDVAEDFNAATEDFITKHLKLHAYKTT
ncbi:MAG: alpha/beta hydrolase [Desulfobacterales bacterium]